MTARMKKRQVPRTALTQAEAAESMGMSIDTFCRYVKPDVPVIRVGTMRLYRPGDLDAWAEQNAEITLEGAV